MAVLNSCLCCSLLTGSILTGITSTVLYLMSFGLELWWIVDAGGGDREVGDKIEYRLPIPAYVLALSYFSMFLLSAGMLVGLRTRSTKLLLSWVLLVILLICPEAGMVLFMAIFHWDGATEGIIEIGMWILRVLFNVAGMICTQSLYVHWRNEKAVIRSLNDLSVTTTNGMGSGYLFSNGITTEYQTKKVQQAMMYEQAIVQQTMHQLHPEHREGGYCPEDPPNFGYEHRGVNGYQNAAYQSSSQDPLGNGVIGNGPRGTDLNIRPLRRSASSASQLIAGYSGIEGRNDMYHQQLPMGISRIHGANTGYRKNEFDTSKFSLNHTAAGLNRFAPKSHLDVFTGNSFGLDPDAPLFVSGPYGPGGLPLDQGRPLSGLSSGGRRSKQRYHHFNNADSFDANNGSDLQWYRPKSLSHLDDDEERSSIWSETSSDINETSNEFSEGRRTVNPISNHYTTQSLDRRKLGRGGGFVGAPNRHAAQVYRHQQQVLHQQQNAARFQHRTQSISGGLNIFGWSAPDDGIVRGGVGPMMHYSNYGGNNRFVTGESKQSLGTQFSDHIETYRDVAL